MNNRILSSISSKNDYLTVLESVTGTKTSFTEEEKAKLLAAYTQNAERGLGFENELLVKAALAMDVTGANLLDKADADALTALTGLCRDWEPDPNKAAAVKSAALSGDVSQPLALALARAALDAYAGQNDISSYRDEVIALSEFLGQVEDKEFEDASVFLIRVRERVQGTAGGKTHE